MANRYVDPRYLAGPSYGTIVPTTGAPVPPPLGWSRQPRTTPFQTHTPAPALGGGIGPRPAAPAARPLPDSQISWNLGAQPAPYTQPIPGPGVVPWRTPAPALAPAPTPTPDQPSPPRPYYGRGGPITHQDLADWFFGLFFSQDAKVAAQENAWQGRHNQALLPGGYSGDGRARATTPYFVR